jgi:hypothetical protein
MFFAFVLHAGSIFADFLFHSWESVPLLIDLVYCWF